MSLLLLFINFVNRSKVVLWTRSSSFSGPLVFWTVIIEAACSMYSGSFSMRCFTSSLFFSHSAYGYDWNCKKSQLFGKPVPMPLFASIFYRNSLFSLQILKPDIIDKNRGQYYRYQYIMVFES